MTNQELEYRALKILEQQPDLTQRQLSEALGVGLGFSGSVCHVPGNLCCHGTESAVKSVRHESVISPNSVNDRGCKGVMSVLNRCAFQIVTSERNFSFL